MRTSTHFSYAWVVAGVVSLAMSGAAASWATASWATASSPDALLPLPPARDASAIAAAFGRLPLVFEPNRGQADPRVRFLARGAGYQVMLMPEGAAIHLQGAAATADGPADAASTTVSLSFPGTRPASALAGEAPAGGTSSYFRGGPARGRIADVPHFARVRLTQLHPGIDLVYYGTRGSLEFDFVLAPGADPARIRMRFGGVDHISLDDTGDLLLQTAAGTLRQHRPSVYQQAGGARRPIDARYVRVDDAEFGIEVAAYDRGASLVVDPVLSYSTFLGGRRGGEAGTAIAVDAAGNAYIAGWTQASDFPLAAAYDTRLGKSDQDVFVAKLNPAGTALVYATYLGGAKGSDHATGIAIDRDGNAYVTGTTSGNDFPTTVSAYQKAPAAGGGAFVTKLAPSGSTLIYSTYLAGMSQTRIAVDAGGNAYVAGQAAPAVSTTAGAFQRVPPTTAGGPFVLALNASGTGVRYATFLGGSGSDVLRALAVDAGGSAYVAGSTTSPDYPVRNALQAARKGASDAYVSRLEPSGTSLVYSTYLGGALDDAINAIALDGGGNAYVAGETYSADFPTRHAAQPVKSGQHLVNSSQGNAFVAKLLPTGNALVYATFLGGEVCYPYYCSSVFNVPQIPGDAAFGIAVGRAEPCDRHRPRAFVHFSAGGLPAAREEG